MKSAIILSVLFLMTGMAAFSASKPPSAEDAANWNERFQKEAPPAWKKYAARLDNLSGTIATKNEQLKPAQRVWWDCRIEVKQRPGHSLDLVRQYVDDFKPDRADILSVVNPHYAFVLRRHVPGNPWAIAKVDSSVVQGVGFRGEAVGFRRMWWESVEAYMTCPVAFSLLPYNFGILGERPGFTAKRVEPVLRDGRTLIKVEIDYGPPAGDISFPSIQGWVVYDPDHSWVVRQSQLFLKHPDPRSTNHLKGVLHELEIDYYDSDPRFSLPRHIKDRHHDYDRDLEFLHEADLDLREAPAPERDFTLSAYGFPEPTRPRPALWFVYAMAAGLVCLIVSIWLRRRSRRVAPVSSPVD